MRSLTVKLTLAFLLVGLVGAVLVALLVGQSTRSEFNRFLSTRDQAVLVSALDDYYTTHGGWDSVDAMLNNPPLVFYRRGMALIDANGRVVLGNRTDAVGQTLSPDVLSASTPITADGRAVGYVRFDVPVEGTNINTRPPPTSGDFLDRLTWAAAISAGIAALIALMLGGVLARTLTRPVRELTAATQALARGDLDQRVVVRSRDEIGTLARSFNQMSDDLARASQQRKQMTADIAHDLRTPLSILRGYTEGLQDGRIQGTPTLYTLMYGEVQHLQRLVEDLRVLSLADAGELSLNRRAVDPAALLERTGLAYIVEAEQHGVALRVEAEQGLPSVAVDTDRLTQVLNNLVSNALRYTPSGGSITLFATTNNIFHEEPGTKNREPGRDPTGSRFSVLGSDSSSIVLQVRDTGSGIAPDDLPFVFDRFYRADKARQRADDPASGLGLAIAKAIVEAHGGTLAVDSMLGCGTTFTISLPAAASRTIG